MRTAARPGLDLVIAARQAGKPSRTQVGRRGRCACGMGDREAHPGRGWQRPGRVRPASGRCSGWAAATPGDPGSAARGDVMTDADSSADGWENRRLFGLWLLYNGVAFAVTPPLAPCSQPAHDVTDLGGGHPGEVIIGPRRTASSTAVHEVRPPSSAAPTEHGQQGPSAHCPSPAHTGQNIRSGLVCASGYSHSPSPPTRQPDSPIAPARQRQRAKRPPQSCNIDPPGVQRVIHWPVATAVLGHSPCGCSTTGFCPRTRPPIARCLRSSSTGAWMQPAGSPG
jgi:hypothetical protein